MVRLSEEADRLKEAKVEMEQQQVSVRIVIEHLVTSIYRQTQICL